MPAAVAAPSPQTLVHKILARHAVSTPDAPAVLEPGRGVFVRADARLVHDIYTAMCRFMLRDPASVIAFEDHYSYAHRSEAQVRRGLLPRVRELFTAHRAFVAEHEPRDHGYLPAGEGSEGISNALMAESYGLPGRFIAGTESHTPHNGALGCLAFGVGTTDMANAMVTGLARLAVPGVLRVELAGALPSGVTAKDVVLHLLALPFLRAGAIAGELISFEELQTRFGRRGQARGTP